jgi:hypothetical protein
MTDMTSPCTSILCRETESCGGGSIGFDEGEDWDTNGGMVESSSAAEIFGGELNERVFVYDLHRSNAGYLWITGAVVVDVEAEE